MIIKRMPRLGDRFFGDIPGFDDKAWRWLPPGETKLYVKTITSTAVALAMRHSRPRYEWSGKELGYWVESGQEHLWSSGYWIKRSSLEWLEEHQFWTIRYKHTCRDRLKWLWHRVRTKRRRME